MFVQSIDCLRFYGLMLHCENRRQFFEQFINLFSLDRKKNLSAFKIETLSYSQSIKNDGNKKNSREKQQTKDYFFFVYFEEVEVANFNPCPIIFGKIGSSVFSSIESLINKLIQVILMSFTIEFKQNLRLCSSLQPQSLSHTVSNPCGSPRLSTGEPEIQFMHNNNRKHAKWRPKQHFSMQHYYLQSNINITLHRRAYFHPKTSHLYYTIKLILNYQKYIKFQNKERRLNFFKTLSQKIIKRSQQNIAIAFHPYSGLVKIVLFNGFLIVDQYQSDDLSGLTNLFYQFDQIKLYLLQILAGIYPPNCIVDNQVLLSNPALRCIQGSMLKMGTGLILPSYNRAESSIVSGEAAQKQKIDRVLQKLVNPSYSQILQLSLFCRSIAISDRRKLFFQSDELGSISSKTKPPTLMKCSSIFENNCIFNYIKLNNPGQMRLNKFREGGFSHIYLAEIEYWYVFSGNENEVISPKEEAAFSRESMFRKVVVYKMEGERGQQPRSRVQHEKEILRKIKNGNALFLPKYYVPLIQVYGSTLFCDYIPSPNLAEYMQLHRESLSPISKSLILLMLIQGIKFLGAYEVYHLDLKPSNVMITKSMMVKIIDFGESYHPQVCNGEFIPGFTMPYGAPETYYPLDRSAFSLKNDIFSFGVIASQLLNNRLPFYFHDEEKHFSRYAEDNFQDFWFYSPEECEERSDPFILSAMELVIGRCLEGEALRRPDVDWLCLIFREFLDFFY